LDQLGTVEHAQPLLRTEPVLHVPVFEDLVERPPTSVLADDVRDNTLLHARTGKEKGKGRAQQACKSLHGAIVSLMPCGVNRRRAALPRDSSTGSTTRAPRRQ